MIEQCDELRDHVLGERREPAAQLRAAERRDADLVEENAALAIGGRLEKQEVERARERPLRIEDVELRFERPARVFDDLIDRRDEEIFFRREVVVDEPRGNTGRQRDALHRCFGEPVLHDRVAQTVDDLAAARLRETRASHRVNWLADQPINVNP